MYSAYVRELGTRLRPIAPILAQKIMEGTAGDVPSWGYKILAAGPDLSLEILTPKLADTNLTTRERATVALGYMGESAAPAKALVEATLKKAPTEGVAPTSHVLPMANVFREDRPAPSLSTEEALSNAPDREGPFFRVPRVIDPAV